MLAVVPMLERLGTEEGLPAQVEAKQCYMQIVVGWEVPGIVAVEIEALTKRQCCSSQDERM